MKITTDKRTKIKLKNEDSDLLKSALQKIVKAQSIVGFKLSDITDKETECLKKLSEKL